jgi:hypothetical protein
MTPPLTVHSLLGRQTASSGFVIFRDQELKTIVYVDGYNLYYGLLRGTPYKWLDLYNLFQNQVLDKSTQVLEVRYYTAPVLKKSSDDPDSQKRQRIYLQALRKSPPNKITIIEGKIIESHPTLRLYDPISEVPHITKARVGCADDKKRINREKQWQTITALTSPEHLICFVPQHILR